ncbi:putative peptidase M15 [Actinobacillus pleuropneumoniae]|nr:putative peptidase M15 [Actinobacillus pleuropneumoniae]KIE88325.1 putative peptidase M15 [Actinobacillus pleuropneumoniae]KIE88392.1 putative peptidase M15 [Actinobacillus pleuropneumoniae]KIE94238.1 putative peptidase M15 [Actinobacillus pleuropneumoniae]KIE94941.1 putative peptidase M15 [Actinobacillus pleuropneumoniae]
MIANLEQILTGKTREHLVPLPNPLSDKHFLQAEAVDAFLTLQQAAKAAGFNLQPASTYRDFDRQMLIWNAKFNGERKVHDDNGCAIDMAKLDDLQKIQAMMRWSAVPGSSRHHWGTEIDIFDPDLLPEGQHLQLEPWEYQTGSYFAPLAEWLHHNAERFGFYFPFDGIHNAKVGYELGISVIVRFPPNMKSNSITRFCKNRGKMNRLPAKPAYSNILTGYLANFYN